MERAQVPSEGGLSETLVLLGAGASVEADVPATFEMTERLVAGIGESGGSRSAQTLHYVCGALIEYDTAAGKSPYAGLDVERVFAAVELLAERRTLEVTPFVSAWHPAVDEWDRPAVPSFFDDRFQKALLSSFSNDARDELIKLINAVTGGGTGEAYKQLAREMIQQLRVLVKHDPDKLDYLTSLVEAARGSGGLTVATLNYDLTIENAGDNLGVPAYTGIERWTSEGKWDWPEDGLRLLKLHGSIDWCWQGWDYKEGELPHETLQKSNEPSNEGRRPVVVFGQRGKLQPQGPFLSLVGEFEALLAQANRLIVVGYSFRDEHVNEVIRRWTTEDATRTITFVDVDDPRNWDSEDFRNELVRSLNPFRPDQESFEARVEHLNIEASKALPTLFGGG